MSTYTPNYNLEKPDSTDDFKDFRSNYNSNMDIIDANLGGGGGGNVDDVLVNGVSVVDGNHDAQITSYKEVTQAEYDALPSSKLTDGIAYFIKDAGGGGGGSSSHNYSTTEQVIGTWIDGKPLYEKVLVKKFDSSMSGTQYSWNHNISDIETCVSFQGYHVNDAGAIQGNRIEPVNISANTNFVGQNTIILYQFSSTQLRWAIGNTWVNPTYMPKALIAIVQYTKTTD